ncbi:MAG: MFS transporter [bacterium]
MLFFLIKNKPLKILIIINGIFSLGAYMFPPVFALFVKELGGGVLDAGTIWATYAIIAGLLVSLIIRYGDNIKEKEYLVAAGYAFRILAWTGYIFVSALWQLYALQILLAIGESLGAAAFNAIYSEHLEKNKYVGQWGAWNSSNTVIGGLAALSGGLIVFHFGFQVLFVVMTALAIISFILLMIQPRQLL